MPTLSQPVSATPFSARIRWIRPPKPRRSASMMWPTHSFADHSSGVGRQPPSGSPIAVSSVVMWSRAARSKPGDVGRSERREARPSP